MARSRSFAARLGRAAGPFQALVLVTWPAGALARLNGDAGDHHRFRLLRTRHNNRTTSQNRMAPALDPSHEGCGTGIAARSDSHQGVRDRSRALSPRARTRLISPRRSRSLSSHNVEAAPLSCGLLPEADGQGAPGRPLRRRSPERSVRAVGRYPLGDGAGRKKLDPGSGPPTDMAGPVPCAEPAEAKIPIRHGGHALPDLFPIGAVILTIGLLVNMDHFLFGDDTGAVGNSNITPS